LDFNFIYLFIVDMFYVEDN